MNARTIPASQLKNVLILTENIAVHALVLLAINPTNWVKILNCSKFLF
jgi:hypothetical protein